MLAVGEHVLGELDPRMAKMPTPFAGGVGDTREEMCGALSGGLMVIGALCGRTGPDETDDTALRLATRYRELFAEAGRYSLRPGVRAASRPGRNRFLRGSRRAGRGDTAGLAELIEREGMPEPAKGDPADCQTSLDAAAGSRVRTVLGTRDGLEGR